MTTSHEPTHDMHVPALSDGEPRWESLPAGPAVLELLGPHGHSTLLATTADARAWAKARLAVPIGEQASARRTDHRAVTSRVLAHAVGSAFEAECIYLDLARIRMPGVYRVVAERWRAWFVHVDPDAEHPEFTKTNLTTTVPPSGIILGPIADKDAAGRFMESLIDSFDLCRFQSLLVLTPHASPCAYKEMGRCPAPCDGTEPIADYRRRVRIAIEFVTSPGGVRASREVLDSHMREAAAAANFERAQECKHLLARSEPLAKPALAGARHIGTCAWVIITRATAPSRARIVVADAAGLRHACDAELSADAPARLDVCTRVLTMARDCASRGITPPGIETLGIVCRRLTMSAAKSKCRVLPLEASRLALDATALHDDLWDAIRAVLKRASRPRAGAPTQPGDADLPDESELGAT
jgi:SAM-dependent methyltransferase